MNVRQFTKMANEVLARWPDAELHKNDVGNLAVLQDGEYVGYLDLRTGEVIEI